MSSKYFYTVGIAFTSGIFVRSFFDMGFAGVLLFVVISVACVVGWRLKSTERGFESPLFFTGLALFAFSLGLLRMQVSEMTPPALQQYEGQSVTLTAKIIREPEIRETNVHLYVRQEGMDDTTGDVILVTTSRFTNVSENLSYGDVVQVEGTLTRPESFATDGGRMFDYAGYLKARGVTYIIGFANVHILTEESGTFLGYIFKGKKKFQETLEAVVPEPYAGLGEGVLLGVKRAMGKELEETFRKTGIIHIVVLSGYNIMIVVQTITFMLSYIFFPRVRMIIGMVVIVLFALLVGLSATVVRASVMAGLLLFAQGTGRTYAVLRALMFAGIGMLILNPYLLVHDPGFQLSFLATLGLVLLSPTIESRISRVPEIVGIRSFITATLATQIFVLPILLYQMGTFSVVAVVVNVLVLPMVPIAMLLTFLTGIVGMFSSVLGYGIGYITYLSLKYIISIAVLFGSLPFASFSLSAFPFWVVVIAYLFLGYVMMRLRIHESDREIIIRTPKKNKVEKEIVNDYEGWVIEEETETSREALRASRDVKTKLPFR